MTSTMVMSICTLTLRILIIDFGYCSSIMLTLTLFDINREKECIRVWRSNNIDLGLREYVL